MLLGQQAIALHILGKGAGDAVDVLLLNAAAAVQQPGVFVGDVAVAVTLQRFAVLLQGELGGGVDALGQRQQEQRGCAQQDHRERRQVALAVVADQYRIIPRFAHAGLDTAKHPGFPQLVADLRGAERVIDHHVGRLEVVLTIGQGALRQGIGGGTTGEHGQGAQGDEAVHGRVSSEVGDGVRM